MIAEVYDALKEAGASEEKAKAAATALADYGNRLDRIDLELGTLKLEIGGVKSDGTTLKSDVGSLKTDIASLKSDVASLRTDLGVVKAELAMVKWVVSGIGFGVLLLVLCSFWPSLPA